MIFISGHFCSLDKTLFIYWNKPACTANEQNLSVVLYFCGRHGDTLPIEQITWGVSTTQIIYVNTFFVQWHNWYNFCANIINNELKYPLTETLTDAGLTLGFFSGSKHLHRFGTLINSWSLYALRSPIILLIYRFDFDKSRGRYNTPILTF